MSIVSTIFSSRSSRCKANAHNSFVMDNIFAISFGLGVRFVIDLVGHHDFKFTGTLVGLWEGVVMLHFLRKMPSSLDPYIGYSVRMFIDFLVTESLWRFVLVIVWTGLGMVLADIVPGIWVDAGFNRIWNRFRRDIYYMSRSVPKVAFFPRARTVRFSPSREHLERVSIASSTLPASSVTTPSIILSNPQRISNGLRSPPTANKRVQSRRHIPGSYLSETDTDIGSRAVPRPPFLDSPSASPFGTSHYHSSTYPTRGHPSGLTDEMSPALSGIDLDAENPYSWGSSTSAEMDSSAYNPSEIQEESATVLVDKGKKPESQGKVTPKALHLSLPPTPSSQVPRFLRDPPLLPTASLLRIPVTSDGGDWEHVAKEDSIEKVPPVPSKDHQLVSPAPLPHPLVQLQLPVSSVSTALVDFQDVASADVAEVQFPTPPVDPQTKEEVTSSCQGAEVSGQPESNPGDPLPQGSGQPSYQVLLDSSSPPPYQGCYSASNSQEIVDNNDTKAIVLTSTDSFGPTLETEGEDAASTFLNNDMHVTSLIPSAVEQEENNVVFNNPEGQNEIVEQQPNDQSQEQDVPSTPSIISSYSMNTSDRLHKAIILHAQMLQLERVIESLKRQKAAALSDGGDVATSLAQEKEADILKTEKSLAKLKRKAVKKYEEALENTNLDDNRTSNDLDVEAFALEAISEKIEAALEMILTPDTRSFKFVITAGKAKQGKAQKPLIMNTLSLYGIIPEQDKSNMRLYITDMTADKYQTWLIAFRQAHNQDAP